MNVENLIKKFEKANLELVAARRPIARTGNDAVFQMDISTKVAKGRDEIFTVWPGAESNVAVVQAFDAKLEQVVLFVKEDARQFWERIPTSRWRVVRTLEDIRKRFSTIGNLPIVKSGGVFWVSRTTPAEKRHFLVGRDERQLFMCRLPHPCTSVLQAHAALKNPQIESLELRADGKTVRQGEWFFVSVPEAEDREIERAVAEGASPIHRRRGIGSFIARPGKPHVADEIVVHRPVGFSENRVYVRGAVRHPDHKTVKLLHWHLVLRNSEPLAATSSLFGGRWMD
jgi:hypothetical protein